MWLAPLPPRCLRRVTHLHVTQPVLTLGTPVLLAFGRLVISKTERHDLFIALTYCVSLCPHGWTLSAYSLVLIGTERWAEDCPDDNIVPTKECV
jgi:hypothetical protein